MGVVAAISDAVDRHARDHRRADRPGRDGPDGGCREPDGGRSADLPSLFGPSPEEVQRAIGRLASGDRFSILAREFFARLTQRTLGYFLSRELANHIGAANASRRRCALPFNHALDRHCREASRIVEEFAGGWYGKNVYQGEGLTPDAVRRFAPVAFRRFGPNFGSAEMPTNEHLVLCGGVAERDRAGTRIILNLHGASANVHLKRRQINISLL